jgi:predicted TIM-barrel fold metal-dependent hydrolase
VIIDFHCHAGKGDAMTAPWNTDAPLGAYLRRARAAGIDKTVVFPLFHDDYDRANHELARLIARHPDRLVGFAFVHARRDRGRIKAMVERAVTQWGFRGIKVHGHEAMPGREVCEAARAFRLPLLVDVAGKPSIIEMLAPEYRDVNFVVPHLGSFTDDWRAHQQVIDQLVRHPNVYCDTSGVRRFDYLVQAVRRAGAYKIIYGSDGPWLHPGVEIEKVRLLSLSEPEEMLILGGNAVRLLSSARNHNRRETDIPKQTSRTGREADPSSRSLSCLGTMN